MVGLGFRLIVAAVMPRWARRRAEHRAEAEAKPSRVTTCSFCGKGSGEVGPMAEGPMDVYICGTCAPLAVNIIENEKRKI